MDISGINSNFVNSTIESAKSKASEESFEKRLTEAMNSQDEKELKSVCQEFESIMLNMMYKQMKATVPKSSLIPSDVSRDIFDSMMDEKLMDEVSKSNSFGLADVLYKQLAARMKTAYEAPEEGEKSIDP